MATPAWDTDGKVPLMGNIENEMNDMWSRIQRSRQAWKCEQRLALFDCGDAERVDFRPNDARQLRQLQSVYEKVERRIVELRQLAMKCEDNNNCRRLDEFLRAIVQSSCLCVKQPPAIVDSESKRSRPKVDIVVLCGKISGILQDERLAFGLHLLTVDQGRTAAEGKGPRGCSEYKVEWYGKKPVPLIWDSVNRLFRARFNDVTLKKPAGNKWQGGYHLYFCTTNDASSGQLPLWTLSTPFEIVSNRTGQTAVKTRDEFWRLAFCTNDVDGSTVGLRPAVPVEPFLQVFARWFQGYTGAKTGMTEEHKRSVRQILKAHDGMVAWERLKKEWPNLYAAANYVKQNTFLWNAGILNYCFATREETEKLLSQFHEPVMLIRFQQSAPGNLSISLITPAETADDGRYFAHCPLEKYLKGNYTLVQCIEFADLICPRGKRLKGKVRDFKVMGASDTFEYRQILEEDERNREQLYASLQSKQNMDITEQGETGPIFDYSSVKERFKIKMSKFPEDRFVSVNSPLSAVNSPQPTGNDWSPQSQLTPFPVTQGPNHHSPQQFPSVVPSISPNPVTKNPMSMNPVQTEDGLGQNATWNSPQGHDHNTTAASANYYYYPMNGAVPGSFSSGEPSNGFVTTNVQECDFGPPGSLQSHGVPDSYYSSPANGDQPITDDDLSVLLEVFQSFNETTVPDVQAGTMTTMTTDDQSAFIKFQNQPHFIEDPASMDFEQMDFVVSNRQ